MMFNRFFLSKEEEDELKKLRKREDSAIMEHARLIQKSNGKSNGEVKGKGKGKEAEEEDRKSVV